MKPKKLLAYTFLPAVLSVGFLAANMASAQGMYGNFNNLSADEIATRQQTMFQNEAQILGISVDELKDGWAEGKNLKEIATAKGITAEQLQAKLKEAQIQKMKTQLQTLVNKGIITQAQADKRLTAMQKLADNHKARMHRGRQMFRPH